MNKKLLKELRAIGAPDHEIEALGKTAERLEAVHVPGLSRAARQRVANRLPVDIDAKEPRHRISPRLFFAFAGSFAVLAIAVVGFSQSLLPSTAPEHGEKARGTEQQTKADAMLEKQAAQIQELKQQEVIDEQAVQKAQDEFQRSYEKYEQRAAQEQDFKNKWQNYRQEWWWGSQQSAPLPAAPQTDSRNHWR
jgi:gas vesicle protein